MTQAIVYHGGHGGGLVVSLFAFYSGDLSSNPADGYDFLHEKTKIKKQEAGVSFREKIDNAITKPEVVSHLFIIVIWRIRCENLQKFFLSLLLL